jgi:hypothetical protein
MARKCVKACGVTLVMCKGRMCWIQSCICWQRKKASVGSGRDEHVDFVKCITREELESMFGERAYYKR